MRVQLANSIEILNKITKNNSMKILLVKEDRYLLNDVFKHLKSEDSLQFLSSWLRLQVILPVGVILLRLQKIEKGYLVSVL